MDNVIVIKPSARYVIFRTLAILFAFDTLFAAGIILTLVLNPSFDRQLFGIILLIAHTLKFFIIAMFIADTIIRYLSNRFFIVKHHLILDRGIMMEDEKVYELHQIRKINVFQDWFGHSMNYGNIHLVFGDKGYEEKVVLMNVATPKKIAKELEKYLT